MLATNLVDAAVADAVAGMEFFDGESVNKIMLFKNNPTISKTTVFADLTPADFQGYAAMSVGDGAYETFINPITGNREIRVREPEGGFEFKTTGTSGLPQSIYGFALIDSGGSVLYGVEKFDEPITLTAEDQVIDVPQPKFSFTFEILS